MCFFEKMHSRLRPIEKGCASRSVVTRSPATKMVSSAKPGTSGSSSTCTGREWGTEGVAAGERRVSGG